MALFPGVQSKIKKEIDSVVGRDRLPTIEDRPNMPYLNATVKEALRWKPALPLSIARKSNQDDFYRGEYQIHHSYTFSHREPRLLYS